MGDYRELLVNAHQSMAATFDKAIMTLSGGALGLSITFLHDVAPHPTHRKLLATSWSCFVLSLLVTLISFVTSQAAIKARIAELDDDSSAPRAWWRPDSGKWTTWLNLSSAALLIAGAVFLVLFALYNFRTHG
jgi:hypothetical protein